MIQSRKEYCISCNKCYKILEYPDDSIMVGYRGQPIYEDTIENIKKVAEDMGWDIEKHLCEKCKQNE